MDLLLLISLILTVIVIVYTSRIKRDKKMLTEEVRQRGGEPVQIRRAKKGQHPFPDTGRGWWAWQISYKGTGGERTSYALTTREGLKEWRD